MQSTKTHNLPENPREQSNSISTLCFWYTLPTFIKGRKKTLQATDLYGALKEHKSDTLGSKLSASWNLELKKYREKASLLRALMRVFGWYFGFLGLVLFVLLLGVSALQPIFLQMFIAQFTDGLESVSTASSYAAGMILCSALNVAIMHPYSFASTHLGFKLRVGMGSMIYRKALRLRKGTLGETTAGHVINLISNDLGRMDTFLMFTHYLWVGPLQTILVTCLMYREIGISAVLGVAFMLLFIPLQMYLGNKISNLRQKTAKRTDKRMQMMNEIVSGIQVIKMYAWERPFEQLVAYARQKEINAIRHSSYIKMILLSFYNFLTRVSIFLSLVGFVLLGHFLSPGVAFLITAYYNVLRPTMTVYFPLGITQTAETLVSIKRVQQFLKSGKTELELGETEHSQTEGDRDETEDKLLGQPVPIISDKTQTHSEAHISISGLKAKWDKDCPEYILKGVDLRLDPGTMLAIVGRTGSGKSSLIQAILGELRIESGDIKVKGSVSYASQEPWLFNGTVRQNILFGQPMDRRRYANVVRQCALERDFELLPLKDKTVVGERGASLSGGQKARIGLARAVYREASIYFLDDPLSAVDTHVARHLFEQCMRGYLRDRIVVLATHQLQFLQHADQIVVLDKGQVSASGTYESLVKSGVDFGTILGDTCIDEPSKELATEPKEQADTCNQRSNSELSLVSTVDTCSEDKVENMVKVANSVGLTVYTDYFRAGGGFFAFFVMTSFFLGAQGLASLGDYFMSYWVTRKGHSADKDALSSGVQDSSVESSTPMWLQSLGLSGDAEMQDTYIFMLITVLTIAVTLERSYLFHKMAMKASVRLHNHMFRGISRAAMYFFNSNSSGSILNRFSNDMGQVDEILPKLIMDFSQSTMSLAGAVIILAIVNPLFLLPVLLLGLIFHQMRNYYLKTSQDIKRVEAAARSPVYSHLASSLAGLSTIRAFGAQQVLEAEFNSYQDMHSSASYMFISTSRAFGYWMDMLCVVYILIVTLTFFIYPAKPGDVGLAITQAISLTSTVQWGIRQSAEMENLMISVERVLEYEDIEPEGKLDAPKDKRPPKTWPDQGTIVFDDLSLRYSPDPKAELTLKSLNFVVQSREKVGIVGRTGAGKSSLINALFRLSYNDGYILIDGLDTSDMGLHDLRSKISIIPQEPVLFSGTMRYNLDPFDEYSDDKLWRSLEEVKLKDVVANMSTGLQTKITEGGTNFSVGQRQLVCLARAILRENRILVMDEATANVDPQTDALIQTTIRDKFKECTVLTIAHRLHTIMDSDKVLVMDAGRVVEYGSPFELLTEADSKVFHGMVKQTGQATYDELFKIAEKAFPHISTSNSK